MIADTLHRIAAALRPEVEADVAGRRGLLKLATDREEALIMGIRDVSTKWQALLWLAGVTGAEGQDGRKGVAVAEIRVAVACRPRLTRDRSDKALDRDDELSLLNLWQTVRGLMVRLRFGSIAYDEPAAGMAQFRVRDGYLDGHLPPRMGTATFTREWFEVKAAEADTGDLREMLWAESQWFIRLALPVLPLNEADASRWLLCA